MKKLKFFFLVAIICFSFCASACTNKFSIVTPNEIKNYIILIGDGMGFNHIANAKTYFDIDSFSFETHKPYEVTTYSKSHKITDSAAAATALATGHKATNGRINRSGGKDLEHIMSIAQKYGKKNWSNHK